MTFRMAVVGPTTSTSHAASTTCATSPRGMPPPAFISDDRDCGGLQTLVWGIWYVSGSTSLREYIRARAKFETSWTRSSGIGSQISPKASGVTSPMRRDARNSDWMSVFDLTYRIRLSEGTERGGSRRRRSKRDERFSRFSLRHRKANHARAFGRTSLGARGSLAAGRHVTRYRENPHDRDETATRTVSARTPTH
jgi:hypothetical protein